MARTKKGAAPTSPQAKLAAVIKTARDAMRKDAGLNGDLDRIPQLAWLLFLKAFDGLEQNRATQKGTHVVRQPAPSRWQTNADFDYAEGVYDSGYGPQNAARVSHTRQVVFVKPDYWLVFDTMKPADDAPHQYEALFHLDAEDAEVDPGTRAVTVESEGSGLRIIPLHTEGVEVEIVKGRHEAPVQGWLPTGRHNVLRPIPTAVFRWRAAGPSTLAYALVPRERGKEWPAQGVRLLAVGKASLAAEVLLPGGAKDLVARCDPDGAPLPVASLLAGAEVVVVRKSADGAPGTALRVIGQLVN